MRIGCSHSFFFFLNDPATTEIYSFPLHAPLPISQPFPSFSGIYDGALMALRMRIADMPPPRRPTDAQAASLSAIDRKSTRLNSSHANISYAVLCLKKKRKRTSKTDGRTDASAHKR